VSDAQIIELDTPKGLARVHLHPVAGSPRTALVLGHGAGGGVSAPDLQTATRVALSREISVALVEQPYRVAGRRSTPQPPILDAAWTAVLEQLQSGPLAGLSLISGGRSSGARVACRTAAATGAIGVLCLAFPLQPAARKTGTQAPSRLPELEAVRVPMLIVQGERDQFGMPRPGPQREVVHVNGDHSLRSDQAAVAAAIERWLVAVTEA
jgi:predicted alpha/beta-hydrolase family hydrolase